MLTAHAFQITNRIDNTTFAHGPVYAHNPAEALALVRLTFGPALWDVDKNVFDEIFEQVAEPPLPPVPTGLVQPSFL